MFRFRMLGTLDLTDSQGRELRSLLRSPKLLALLGYLAIARPPGFHRRDTLVALLWPELDHFYARSALRQAVFFLREALGEGVLLGRGEDKLGIDGARLWCDVRDLEKALETGEAERALELYGGGLLNGLHVSDVPEFERWLDEEREHVRRLACEAAQLLTDREDAAGNPAGAARWARRLTELLPSDENAVGRLIQLQEPESLLEPACPEPSSKGEPGDGSGGASRGLRSDDQAVLPRPCADEDFARRQAAGTDGYLKPFLPTILRDRHLARSREVGNSTIRQVVSSSATGRTAVRLSTVM